MDVGAGRDRGFADLSVGIDLTMHVVGGAAVLAIVFVPTVNAWILRSL